MSKKDDNIYSIQTMLTHVLILKLASDVKKLEEKQQKTCEMAARSILHALDMKDHYTYGHSMRVAFLSLTVGRELGLNDKDLYELELASLFHDVGKIGVPDAVLLKPSRLNESEFKEMQSHPEKSAEILKGFEDFSEIAKIAKHHHERWDGKGYPSGLKGDEIPLFSRIILIADTFDAMTSSRPYRKGLDYSVAFQELKDFAGTQFDPVLVDKFIAAMKKDKEKDEKTFYLKIVDEKFEKEAA